MMALSATLSVASTVAAAGEAAPRVKTSAGTLEGVRRGEVVSYRAIPYAAPPIGDLRWRAPQRPKTWRGVRKGDAYGPICVQKYQASDNGVGALPMSEDCLTLNVFARADARGAPVMVWIHGGGFVNGSGTAALYDGTELARQGAIIVTLNYRLGRFGFFAHPALTSAAGKEPVGNYALMDMIAALEWVRSNIRKFGGDPRQVTIFGESAGGVAVNALMVSPAARGLFARAIAQSGLGRETTPELSAAENSGMAFTTSLGLTSPTAQDLRKLSADAIVATGDPDLFKGGGAMVDGQILTGSPLAGFLAGREAAVPYLAGWNSLEFPAPASIVSARLRDGPLDEAALARVRAAYAEEAAYDQNLLSDVLFVEPAVHLARLHSDRGYPTFAYQFSVLPKSAPAILKGAPHASERQYVFQTLSASPFPTDANDADQAAAMSAYWIAFAKGGDPNGGNRTIWPRFDAVAGAIMEFTNAGVFQARIPRRAAIESLSAEQDTN